MVITTLEKVAWEDILPESGVMGILGKKRRGKSGLAYYIAELRQKQLGRPAVVWGPAPSMVEQFPRWLKIVEDLQSLLEYPNHTAIVDEGSLALHARQSMLRDHATFDQVLSMCGQLDQLVIFCTHHSRKLDPLVVEEYDVLAFKQPGTMHTRMERREIREWSSRAREILMPYAEEERLRWSYVLYDDLDSEAVVENPLPSFWSEAISKAVSTAMLLARAQSREADPEALLKVYRDINWIIYKALDEYPVLANKLDECEKLLHPVIKGKTDMSGAIGKQVVEKLMECLSLGSPWGDAVAEMKRKLELSAI